MNQDILESLPTPELVAQYVLECRGAGLMLAYDDYSIISEWIKALPDRNQLLLILSETLPPFYARHSVGPPRTLKGVRKKVMERITTYHRRYAGEVSKAATHR